MVVLGPCGLALGIIATSSPVTVLVDLEVRTVLLGQLATLGSLLDGEADATTGEVEIDDLDPQLFAGRDDLLGRVHVVRGHLRDVHETLDAFANLHETTERHQLGDTAVDQLAHLVRAGELLPWILLGGLQRQADALTVEVDIEHLNGDLVANGDNGARVVDVLPRQLADVDETIHAAEVDERAERHDAADNTFADLARLEVGEEAVATFLLRLFQEGTTTEYDVVAVLVQLDDLGLDDLADVRHEIAHTAQLDQRCGQETTQADVDDETALDDLDDRALNGAFGFLDLLDGAPCTLVLGTLLGKDQAAFLVFLRQHQCLDRVAQRHDFVRVDVVADAQLARRDDAFALVTNVEENFVLVDLDDNAVHQLAVLDGDHGAFDGFGERHAEIVGHDLTGGVIALFVKGAPGTGSQEGSRGIGQETIAFGNKPR